jgi:hypothetical protein
MTSNCKKKTLMCMTLLFGYLKKIESYIAIVVGLVSGKCYLNILMVFQRSSTYALAFGLATIFFTFKIMYLLFTSLTHNREIETVKDGYLQITNHQDHSIHFANQE